MKMGAKMVLSRLPLGYAVWRRVGVFRHGAMHDPQYAVGVYAKHHGLVADRLEGEYTVLELGPGDSLATAAVARSYGAAGAILVDTGPWAETDFEPYRRLLDLLRQGGMSIPDARTVEEYLDHTNSRYLTDGLESLRGLPEDSVDFAFSHAVLEHVPKDEVPATLRELHRVLKPGGVMSHQVDLMDHLGGSLNNLRFSDCFWESDTVRKSGFYTNRLRHLDLLSMLDEAGFDVPWSDTAAWDSLPVPREKMAPPWRDTPEDELCVNLLRVVCVPKKQGGA